MFIKFEELELLEFFESEPKAIGEYKAGNWIYSYQQNDFKIVLLISIYEMYIEISINYDNNIVYSQKHSHILEIKKVDSNTIKVIGEQYVIVIKKEPQVGVIVEEN